MLRDQKDKGATTTTLPPQFPSIEADEYPFHASLSVSVCLCVTTPVSVFACPCLCLWVDLSVPLCLYFLSSGGGFVPLTLHKWAVPGTCQTEQTGLGQCHIDF